MSTTIDQQVVEMRFDNRNFEQNVSKTMSTLEKFKQTLRLDGATRGLEDVNRATKGVDMSGLGRAVDTVSTRFSALQVMAVTALANVTNSAVNAAKRMVTSLTVAPVGDGFKEYEMTLNAVQTTMAATGKTSEEVEKQLKSLDEYADKTVYSTADMLNNLPKFTNAGVELEKATTAMIGIANATALAGGDASKASIAFYNLGQAIGTGYLTRMDYNSINNAGIATMEWKNQMVQAAIAQGTLTKVGEDSYKAGKKTYTLQQLFIDGLQEQWATTDVMMKVFGDYGDETTEIGKKSYAAAQDIKTFSQMMESLKATAGTGWKDTWQIIFGNLEEAKEFWTGLTNFISNIITKMADFRNNLLKSALGRGFTDLSKKINTVLEPAKKASETFTKVTDSVKDLDNIVSKVILGNFGNGKERFDALSKAGYNYCEVQNKVNEKLGNSFRYTKEQIDAQDKLIGKQKETTKSTGEVTQATKDRIKQVAKLSEEEAKALGYTDEQIAAFKELGDAAKKLGMPLDEFIDNLDKINGRWLLIESFKNVGKSLLEVFSAIGKAWSNVFPPKSIEERGEKIFDLIAALHKFTRSLIPTEETTKKLERAFAGLFAALDIVKTLVMGPFSIAFKTIKAILGAFNLDILDGLAYVGDMIVKFRNWLKSVLDFNGVFEKLVGLVKDFFKPIKDVFGEIDLSKLATATGSIEEFLAALNVDESKAESFKKIIDGLKAAFDLSMSVMGMSLTTGIKLLSAVLNLLGTDLLSVGEKIADWIIGLRDTTKEHTPLIGQLDKLAQILATVIDGIKRCVAAFLKLEPVQKVIQKIKDAFSNLLGGNEWNMDGFINHLKTGIDKVVAWIESLKDSENIGKDLVMGLIKGIRSGISYLVTTLWDFGKTVISTVCEVFDIHSPSRVFMTIGKFLIAGLVIGILGQKTGLFNAIGGFLGKAIDFVKGLFTEGWSKLQELPPIKWEYLFGIAALAGVIVTIKKTLDILDNFSEGVKGIGKIGSGINTLAEAFANKLDPKKTKMESIADNALKLAIAIGILAASVWLLTTVATPGQLWSSVGAIAALGAVIVALAAILSGIAKKASADLEKVSALVLSLSISLLLLAGAAKIFSTVTWGDLGKAGAAIGGLGLIISGLIAATKIAGKGGKHVDNVALLVRKVAWSMLLLSVAIKIMSTMSWSELGRAGAAIGGLGVLIAGLIWATKLAGNKINSATNLISKIGTSMLLLAVALRIMGGMSWSELGRAGAAIGGLGVLIAGLIWATKLAGPDIDKVGPTILKISAAMLLLSITARILAGMTWGEMGRAAVGLIGLGGVVVGLVALTRLATDKDIARVTSTLLAMSLAISVLGITSIILGLVSLPNLAKGVAAVGLLAGMMYVMIAATRGASEVNKSIMAMAVAIGVMAAAITVLSFIDPTKLKTTAVCMGGLMALFALIAYSSSYAQKAMGSLIVMTLAIGMLAGCIYLLAKGVPNIDAAQGAAGALATLMISMSGALVILGACESLVKKSVQGIAGLMLMAVPLLAFVGVLAVMSNVKNAQANAMTLTLLASAMVLLMIPLMLVGALFYPALLGIVALTAMAVPLIAFVGVLAVMEGLSNAQKNVDILINFMAKITAMLLAVAMVAPLATMAVIALSGMLTLVTAIGVLAVGIGALMEKFPQIESFLNKGIPILEKLAYAIGSFVGNLVSGFVNGVAETIPKIGTMLSDFMSNASGFITGIKAVDASMLKNVAILSASIIALTAADLIAGISSFLQGGSSFAELGTELSQFMMNAMPFIMGVKMVDPASMEGIKSLAEAILILTAADVLDGLTSWFTGGSSLASFGEELAAFGPYMAQYSNAVKGIDSEAVATSAEAAKNLAEMAKALPNEGGLLGKIAGENNMDVFGEQLVSFGKALKNYSIAVQGLNVDAINISVEAGKAVAEMAECIPNLGGVVGWFTGDNDLATFGTQLVSFGSSLKQYSIAVTGLALEPIKLSVEAGKALAEMADSIPNLGGVVSWFTGDNDLATFGTQIVSFGSSLLAYSLAVTGLAIEPINNSISAARSLAQLATVMPSDGGFWSWLKDDAVSMADFGAEIIPLGEGMATYSEKVKGINITAVNGSVNAARSLVSFIKSISDLDATGVTNFVSALSTLGKAAVDKFIKAFTSAKGNLTQIGSDMITAVQNGIKTKTSSLTSAVSKLISDMINKIKSKTSAFKDIGGKLILALIAGVRAKYPTASKNLADIVVKMANTIKTKRSNWKSAGKYLVEGFAEGITANTYKAEAKSRAMALAALEAAQKALKIESPSKVARDKVGRYFVQGVAEGIKKDMSAEEQAAKKAQNIVNAFKEEFDKLDLDVTTADLEHELWSKTTGVDASDAEKNTAELNRLTKNYQIQLERVALAQGEYEVMKKELGENSKETLKYYNEFLQEQIDLVDLSNKIAELQEASNTNTSESFNAYAEWMKTHRKQMEEYGMSLAQIKAAAQQATGYNPFDLGYDFDKTIAATETVVTGIGETYGAAMNSGMQSTSTQALTTTSTMVQSCVDRIKEFQPDWITGGSYLVDGFIKGIDNKIYAAAEKAAEMATKAYTAAMDAIGVESPSKAFAELGMYADLGFAKGLSDYADTASDASAEMATGALSGLKGMVHRLTDTIDEEVGAHAVITPVLDLSNVQNGVSQLKGLFAGRSAELAASANVSVNSSNNIYDYIDQMQKINNARDSEIVGALGELRGDFGSLIDAISNLGIQLDDGTMVGKIINKIDTGLGRIANHKGRGN